VAVGLAKNDIANEVDAYIKNAGLVKATGAGGIDIEAINSATITATAVAASAAVGAGWLGGLSISGAGADAFNVILTKTRAYADNSGLVSAGNIDVTATDTSTINAKVRTVSAAVSTGIVAGAVSIGAATARNYIGYTTGGASQPAEVLAYLKNSTADAASSVNLSATESATIKADIASESTSVAIGAIAVAASGAGVSIQNKINTDVRAFIEDTNASDAIATLVKAGGTGLSVSATDTSTITADAKAVSFSAAIGLGGAGAISLSFANNTVDNLVEAYAKNAKIVTTGANADLAITATENATITSTSKASAAAFAALIATSGAGATSDATVNNTTRAYADPVELNIGGDVAIDAISTAKATATTTGTALSVGFIAVSVVKTEATATVTPLVESRLGGYTTGNREAKANGTISVGSTMDASATATASGGSVAAGLGVAQGAPTATATIKPQGTVTDASTMVLSSISGGKVVSTAGNINVKANYNSDPRGAGYNGSGAVATAYAASGGLVGIAGATAIATDTPYLDAYVGSGATLGATAGTVTVSTSSASKATTKAAGQAGGLVGVGASHATSTAQSNSEAYVAGSVGSVDVAGAANLNVSAYSADDARASSQAVSGGLVANSQNDSTATVSPTVKAYLGTNSIVNVSGSVGVTATADPEADAATKGGSSGFVAVGGSVSTTTVSPQVSAYLGTGSKVLAGQNVTVDANSVPVASTTTLPTYVIDSVNTTADTLEVDNHGLLTGETIEYENGSNTEITGLDGRANIEPTRGTWATAVAYAEGDVVLASDGKTYTAKSAHTSDAATNPTSNGAVWELSFVRREYNVLVTDDNHFALGSEFSGTLVGSNSNSGIDTVYDTILFASAHNFQNGDAVKYQVMSGGTTLTGLNTSATYYVVVVNSLTIRLVAKLTDVTKLVSFTPTNVSGDTFTISAGHGFLTGATVTYDAPNPYTFNIGQVDVTGSNAGVVANLTDTAGNNNIVLTDPLTGNAIARPFVDGEKVLYSVSSDADTPAVAVGGLINGLTYRVVAVDGSNSAFQLKYNDRVTTDVHFVRSGTTLQVVRTDGKSWADFGFNQVANQELIISGVNTATDGTYRISSASGATLTLANGTDNITDIQATRVIANMTLTKGQVGDSSADPVVPAINDTLKRNDSRRWDTADGFTAGMSITISGQSGSFTIQSISSDGLTLTLNTQAGITATSTGTLTVQRGVEDGISSTFDGPTLALAPAKSAVTAAITVARDGTLGDTITRTDGGNWSNSVFAVGSKISIASTVDGLKDNNTSYTIASISGSVIRLVEKNTVSIGSGAATLTQSQFSDVVVSGEVKFVRDTLGDRIVRSTGTWSGFAAGATISVTGTSGNDGQFTIASVSGDTIRLQSINQVVSTSLTTTVDWTRADSGDKLIRRDGGNWLTTNFGAGFTVNGTNAGPYSVVGLSTTYFENDTLVLAVSGVVTELSSQSVTLTSKTLDTATLTQRGHNTGNDVHSLVRASDAPLKIAAASGGGALVDGRTYYVEKVNDTQFKLKLTSTSATALTFDTTGLSGPHAFRPVVDLTGGGTGAQALRIDLTGAVTGTQSILGQGGVSLSVVAPATGDGLSSATSRGSGGGFVGIRANDATINYNPNVSAYIASALVDAGNVSVTTQLKTNATSSTQNGTGGFVGIGDADARSNQTATNAAYIAGSVQLFARGNLTVNANTNMNSGVSSSASAGGFVGLADASSTTLANYNNQARVDSNADLLVAGHIGINADTQVNMSSNSYASGLGFGGDGASHNTINFGTALTQVDLRSGALLTASTLSAAATTSKLNLQADGSAYGAGFYSEGSDRSVISIPAVNNIILGANAGITGLEGVDLVTRFDNVTTKTKSFSRSTGLFGWVSSTGDNTTHLTNNVTGTADALVTAGPRIDGATPLLNDGESSHLAFLVRTDNGSNIHADRDARTSKRSLASGGSHGGVNFSDPQTIDFSSDVRILSGRSAVLDVVLEITASETDIDGAMIQKAVNATVRDDNSTAQTSGSIDSTLGVIFVNDISNPGAGDVVFRAKNAITGSTGLWEFNDALPQVHITNSSNLDLKINNINVLSNRQPVVWLQPTTASRTLTFALDRTVAPSLVSILNTGNGDILLNGTIENPIGTTSIVNTKGSVLSTGVRDAAHADYEKSRVSLVRTNILHIATPGTAESVGADGKRINVDVVDASLLPEPTGFETRRVNDASDAIFLGYQNQFYQGQLVQYQTATGTTAITGLANNGYYYVIASDDGLSVKLATTAANAAARVAINIAQSGGAANLFNDHSLTPVTRFNVAAANDIWLDVLGRQRVAADPAPGAYTVTIDAVDAGDNVNILMRESILQTTVGNKVGVLVKYPGQAGGLAHINYFTPDVGSAGKLHYGAYATGTGTIDSTYDFRGINPAGSPTGLPTLPGVIAGGNIVIAAANQAPTAKLIHVVGITEIEDIGDIDVLTNGNITLTEKTGDMRIEAHQIDAGRRVAVFASDASWMRATMPALALRRTSPATTSHWWRAWPCCTRPAQPLRLAAPPAPLWAALARRVISLKSTPT